MMFRKIDYWKETDSDLDRVLSFGDIVMIGLGSTISYGISKQLGDLTLYTGPAVCLSFLIAGVTITLTVACFAELAAENPYVGSSYSYSFLALGEFMAFNTGWLLILSHIFSTAHTCIVLTKFLDIAFYDGAISQILKIPEVQLMSPIVQIEWMDCLAAVNLIILTGTMLVRLKYSRYIENFLVLVSLFTAHVWLFVGMTSTRSQFWLIPPESVSLTPKPKGSSFMPYGIHSIFKSFTTCYSCYSNFEIVTVTGDEVVDPKHAIPKALFVTIILVTLLFTYMSAIYTLMWPWYDQDLNENLPLIRIMEKIYLDYLKHVMLTGRTCCLYSCAFALVYAQSRVLYAMAKDGMMFKYFSKINTTLKLPFCATIALCILTVIVLAIYEFGDLTSMVDISKQFIYVSTSISLLVLRYRCEDATVRVHHKDTVFLSRLFNFPNTALVPAPDTEAISNYLIFVIVFIMATACYAISFILPERLVQGHIRNGDLTALLLSYFLIIMLSIALAMQPQTKPKGIFQVIFMPAVPLLSLKVNLYLFFRSCVGHMLHLLFIIAIGQVVYWRYSIWESTVPVRAELEDSKSDLEIEEAYRFF